jgi:hypothetical protein
MNNDGSCKSRIIEAKIKPELLKQRRCNEVVASSNAFEPKSLLFKIALW